MSIEYFMKTLHIECYCVLFICFKWYH